MIQKKTFLIILVILFLQSLISVSQNVKIDSLENLLKQNTQQDTTRVLLLNETAYELRKTDQNKTIKYAIEAGELADKLNFTKGKANSLRTVGIIYKYQANYPKALQYYHESLELDLKSKNKKGISSTYNNIGIVYQKLANHPKALAFYKKALSIYIEQIDKEGIAKCYNNIGIVYQKLADYQKALEYQLKSLEIKKVLGNKKGLSKGFNNIGIIYYYQGNYPKALEYYHKSLKITQELDDQQGVAKCYNNLGNVYKSQSAYSKALAHYQKALTIRENLGDSRGVSMSYNNLGNIYTSQSNYPKALEYLQQSLSICLEIGDKQGTSMAYNNIGNIYIIQKDYSKALEIFQKSLVIKEELGDKRGISLSTNNTGSIYNLQGNYVKALTSLQKSLAISIEIGDDYLQAMNYTELGIVYFKKGEAKIAIDYGEKALAVARNIGNIELIKDNSEILAKAYASLNLYKEANKYNIIFKIMNDSLYNERNIKKIANLEYQYKYEKEKKVAELEQQKKDAVRAEEEKQQKKIRNLFIGGFVLMFMLVIVILYSFLQKRKANGILAQQKDKIEKTNNQLNVSLNIVNKQKSEITVQHKEIVIQRDKLSLQNQHITDSINYAYQIQTAVLPSNTFLEEILPEHFILFKPLNIVSGDFYWIQKKGKKLMVAIVDCTGHGVPGAFMSMLGISFLNEIVGKHKVTKASQVLDELRNQIKTTLGQTGKFDEAKDGMDMAFYIIDTETNEMQFSGAHNPLYLFRESELIEYKADKQPIGIFYKETAFTNYKIQLKPNDVVYTFSDGFIDQFGGPKGRKFLSKQFKQVLGDMQGKSMKKQKIALEKEFSNWRGELEQIDDVLVMGMKI